MTHSSPLAGVKIRPLDVLSPGRAAIREGAKLLFDGPRSGAAADPTAGVVVPTNVREALASRTTDNLMRSLRNTMIDNPPSAPITRQRTGSVFGKVVAFIEENTDISINPQTEGAVVGQVTSAARRKRLNKLFESVVHTMDAAVEDTRDNGPGLASTLLRYARKLRGFAVDTVRLEADTGGYIIQVLSERVGDAIANVGQGTGDALQSIIGATPKEYFDDYTTFALGMGLIFLGIVAGGALLLATPTGGLFLGKAVGGAATTAKVGAKVGTKAITTIL